MLDANPPGEAAPDVAARFDLDLRCLEIDAAVERATGLAREAFLGRTQEEIGFPPEHCAVWRRAVAQALETDAAQEFDFDIATPSGRRCFRTRLVPERDEGGAVVSLQCRMRDVSDSRTLSLLKSALARLPVGVALVEAPSGAVLFRNEEASLIFGRDPTVGTVRELKDYGGFTGFKADGSAYAPEEWPLSRSIRSGEVVVAEEAEIRRLDGSRGYIRMSSTPVRDAQGRIVAGVVTFHDITASKRLEQDHAFLAAASALLAAAVDTRDALRRLARLAVPAMADWCIVHERHHGELATVSLEHVDPQQRRLAEEMAARFPVDASRPNAVTRVLAGGPAELYQEITPEVLDAAAADGAQRDYLQRVGFRSAMVVPLAGRTGVLGTITFISAESGRRYSPDDLRLAEDLARRAGIVLENARLLEAERHARAAAEASQAETAVLYRLSAAANRARTPDEVYQAALDAIRDVLGAPRASVLTFDAAGVMRFRAWRGLSEPYRRAVEGHSPWTADDAEARPIVVDDLRQEASLAAYGEVFEREDIRSLAFVPLVYGDRLVGKFMLYSAEPHAWQPPALAKATAIAAQVSSAVGRSLAEQAMRDANRRKDEFLAMLSHELRNPLAAVRNAVHVLNAGVGEPARRHAGEVIDRQSANLVRIVDDLLDVSRITRGRVELRRERLDLRSVVQRALAAASPLLAGHRLTVELGAEPLAVAGDPVRLEQVVSNLLANAARYTPAGGSIQVTAAREAGELLLRVRDEGIGIEAERLERIFELFDQGGRDLARTQGGLGIGLTIVRGLVELHDGRVWAASDGPDTGSEFIVRLPALAEAPAEPGRRGSGEAPAPIRRVLVVDDHLDSALMLATMLESWGHTVAVENEAEAVLGRVRALRPEVVLLDIGLPRIDGYTLARAIRADPELGGVRLVALTGYGQPSDRDRALACGFFRHLAKPVSAEELRGVLAAGGS